MEEFLLFNIIILFIKYPLIFATSILCGTLFIYLINSNDEKNSNIEKKVEITSISKSTQTEPTKSSINYILN
jgi:hypothetical protein